MTRNVHKQLIFYSIVFLVASYVYVACEESSEILIIIITLLCSESNMKN